MCGGAGAVGGAGNAGNAGTAAVGTQADRTISASINGPVGAQGSAPLDQSTQELQAFAALLQQLLQGSQPGSA